MFWQSKNDLFAKSKPEVCNRLHPPVDILGVFLRFKNAVYDVLRQRVMVDVETVVDQTVPASDWMILEIPSVSMKVGAIWRRERCQALKNFFSRPIASLRSTDRAHHRFLPDDIEFAWHILWLLVAACQLYSLLWRLD
jgi:hypothetical protein